MSISSETRDLDTSQQWEAMENMLHRLAEAIHGWLEAKGHYPRTSTDRLTKGEKADQLEQSERSSVLHGPQIADLNYLFSATISELSGILEAANRYGNAQSDVQQKGSGLQDLSSITLEELNCRHREMVLRHLKRLRERIDQTEDTTILKFHNRTRTEEELKLRRLEMVINHERRRHARAQRKLEAPG